MNRRTTSRKPARRAAALALGVAAVTALPLGLTASARATPVEAAKAAAAAPRTVTGSPSDSVTRIADFYGAYIDAQSGPGEGGKLAAELRTYYIHPDYLKKLVAWEERNHADGVLRAQNVPLRWSVTGKDGTADHTEAVIKLTWGSGSTTSTTRLIVDMSQDHRIINIGTKGIGGK